MRTVSLRDCSLWAVPRSDCFGRLACSVGMGLESRRVPHTSTVFYHRRIWPLRLCTVPECIHFSAYRRPAFLWDSPYKTRICSDHRCRFSCWIRTFVRLYWSTAACPLSLRCTGRFCKWLFLYTGTHPTRCPKRRRDTLCHPLCILVKLPCIAPVVPERIDCLHSSFRMHIPMHSTSCRSDRFCSVRNPRILACR